MHFHHFEQNGGYFGFVNKDSWGFFQVLYTYFWMFQRNFSFITFFSRFQYQIGSNDCTTPIVAATVAIIETQEDSYTASPNCQFCFFKFYGRGATFYIPYCNALYKKLQPKKSIKSSLQVGFRYVATAKTRSGNAYQKAYIFQAVRSVINEPQQPY